MSWHALAVGISTKFDADTGAGGLVPLVDPLVTGSWNIEAPQEAVYPYIVFSPTLDEEFDSYTSGDNIRAEFDVAIYANKSGGTADVAEIAARVRTLLHRQAVTPGTGFALAGRVLRKGSTGPIVDDQVVWQVEIYEAVLVKT